MNAKKFFDRDLSWLSFNSRLLDEAANETVPLMERIRFLSIWSSNLDEFYRVRMPVVMALDKTGINKNQEHGYKETAAVISRQQKYFGHLIDDVIVPELVRYGLFLPVNKNIPAEILPEATNYFFEQVAGLLQPRAVDETAASFTPENNRLYIVTIFQQRQGGEKMYLVNVPSNNVPRFFKIQKDSTHILFLEDIIRLNLHHIFPSAIGIKAFNIKVTRDAALDLQDELATDLALAIEAKLGKRELGDATRLLYEPGISLRHLYTLVHTFNLKNASLVPGGVYHNLKDLAQLPIADIVPTYPAWPAKQFMKDSSTTLFERMAQSDMMLHTPYHSYDDVVRFFNEASIDETVKEIYTTLYRVAGDSRIVQALMSAAKNGKKVTVLVELKARFDEANNIKWAKQMKAAGVKIIYSRHSIKVHAKTALVKREHPQAPMLGLVATGNFNEATAKFYTDHVLFTSNKKLLTELELLFGFLSSKKLPSESSNVFDELLVSPFNLLQKFIELIDVEIGHAKKGLPASITIKLNNLEEETLISKLYEASCAGVKIEMIVRGICRLVPGVAQQSENITVKRVVDRYLEHGRVFIFHNNGSPKVYIGSSDWMNRNIYHRIEVCCPVLDASTRDELVKMVAIQWNDNVKAVYIDQAMNNVAVKNDRPPVRSQEAIANLINAQNVVTV
jgi:polyphosphate kinase